METVSLGTMMSPLAGGRQRLMTRSLRRVLVISMEPLERAMPILRPAKARIWFAQAPVALITQGAAMA